MAEEKIVWDKQALINYVTDIIKTNFDDEIECTIDYSKNRLEIE